MSDQVFHETGLHKLTDQELEALNNWLQNQHTTKAAPPALQQSVSTPTQEETIAKRLENFGMPEPTPAEKDKDIVLQANIKAPFRGWNGKTIFRLDNGQIWQQRVSGRYTYSGDDTRVEISVNSWGFYELKLVAAGRSVGVKRLK